MKYSTISSGSYVFNIHVIHYVAWASIVYQFLTVILSAYPTNGMLLGTTQVVFQLMIKQAGRLHTPSTSYLWHNHKHCNLNPNGAMCWVLASTVPSNGAMCWVLASTVPSV